MSRQPELHDRFADWLATRPPGVDDEPPRDLGLHAAACVRCLREATALDGLARIDIGAIDLPNVTVAAERTGRLVRIGRYAIAGAALVLVGGAVAIGSTLIPDAPPTAELAQSQSFGEGVLAGAPSATASASSLVSPTLTHSPSAQPSASPGASDAASVEPVAPPTAAPLPTAPLPTQAPTAAPTERPSTPTPTPTAAASATVALTPAPSPTPPPPTASPATPTPAPSATPPTP